jgi:uncharacterized membrane protein YdcZ (DUF606 family)
MSWTLIVLSVLVGIPRALGIKHVAYQALAHLWVGGMFGAAFATRKPPYLSCAIGLTVLEILCFLASLGR